ncbi:hypothetical protein CMI48_01510 [Candidatus Pacearchaeota archaeon]|nr:hypothetical protein [Candidatus Pacearchaeota archaeon]
MTQRNDQNYTKIAQVYEEHLHYQTKENLFTWAIKNGLQDQTTIGVVGPGPGIDVKAIAEKRNHCTLLGAEPNTALFRQSKSLAKKLKQQGNTNTYHVYQKPLQDLPPQFQNLDTIFCSFSLHEALDKRRDPEELEAVLKDLVTRIKPKGNLIILDFEYTPESTREGVEAHHPILMQDLKHFHEKTEIFQMREILKAASKHFQQAAEPMILEKARYLIINEYGLILQKR